MYIYIPNYFYLLKWQFVIMTKLSKDNLEHKLRVGGRGFSYKNTLKITRTLRIDNNVVFVYVVRLSQLLIIFHNINLL